MVLIAKVASFWVLNKFLKFCKESDACICQVNLRKHYFYITGTAANVFNSDSKIVSIVDFKALILFVAELVGLGKGSVLKAEIFVRINLFKVH